MAVDAVFVTVLLWAKATPVRIVAPKAPAPTSAAPLTKREVLPAESVMCIPLIGFPEDGVWPTADEVVTSPSHRYVMAALCHRQENVRPRCKRDRYHLPAPHGTIGPGGARMVEGVTSPSRLSRKDAIVAALVAAVMALTIIASGREFPATGVTKTSATTASAAEAPSLVVAVDSADPAAVAAAWRAVPAASLPGQVLVIPASNDPTCPQRIADSGMRAAEVLTEVTACSVDPAARASARSATLREAAAQARASRTSLVLLGEGWTQSVPLPVNDPTQAKQIGDAVLAVAAAGQLPNLRGLTVVIAAPVPPPTEKAVWDAYFTAAGARKVEWVRI